MEPGTARRKENLRGVLAVVGFFACATATIWLAVARDAVLLLEPAVASFVGSWWHDKRRARRREQATDETEGPDTQLVERLSPPSQPSG